jgi:hypothetical protein
VSMNFVHDASHTVTPNGMDRAWKDLWDYGIQKCFHSGIFLRRVSYFWAEVVWFSKLRGRGLTHLCCHPQPILHRGSPYS